MFKLSLVNLFRKQNGQALLIVVLVMVVALTVGLSVASRSITNLRTSQEQASSQKALSAAEAGIEQAMKNQDLAEINGNFEGNAITYKTTIDKIMGDDRFLLNGGYLIAKDSHVYIWTTPYSETTPWQNPWSGTLTVYWGNVSDGCQDAALEITVISGDRTSPTLTRFAYDPCASRRSSNGFSSPTQAPTTIKDRTLWHQVSLPGLTNVYLVSVNPIYTNSYIGALGSTTLPTQGTNFSSVGAASNEEVQRKVAAFQGFPQIPAELFPYTIFSP